MMHDPRADRQRAREVQSGATRAAVLGVSDGLVTNVSLILGVAGSEASGHFVLLAGLASLVAGAASMAVGEYVSIAAQVELLQRLLTDFREHLKQQPEHARRDLEEFIRRGGVRQSRLDRIHRGASMSSSQSPRIRCGEKRSRTSMARRDMAARPPSSPIARFSACASAATSPAGCTRRPSIPCRTMSRGPVSQS